MSQTVTSEAIVEKLGAKPSGQLLLWRDDDILLRKTPYKSSGDRDFDREALAHWWMNVYVPDGWGDEKTPQEVFNSWSGAIYGNFNYTNVSGYIPATNQSAVRISAYKNEPLEDHLAELNIWLPKIKSIPDLKKVFPYAYGHFDELVSKGSGKMIDIFERSLSASGSYDLWVMDSGHIEVGRFHYSQYDPMFTTRDLPEAIDFIRKRLWYHKKLHEEDDDE